MASYLNPLNVIYSHKYPYQYFPTKKNPPNLKRNSHDLMNEVFNFDFMSNEYVPIFEKYQQREEQEEYDYKEMTLNEIEDRYLYHFGTEENTQEEQLNLIDYTIQPNDTLFGMELRFNINSKKILSINNMSEDCLMPGMVI